MVTDGLALFVRWKALSSVDKEQKTYRNRTDDNELVKGNSFTPG